MQVDHHFQSCAPRPPDGLVQYRKLSLNVRIPRKRVDGPVPNRNADMVQASSCNLVEVVLSDPSVPVCVETRRSFGLAKGLSVRVLVYHGPTRRPFLKDRRSDPRLKHKPTTEVDTADFVVIVIECEFPATEVTEVELSAEDQTYGSSVCRYTYKVGAPSDRMVSSARVQMTWRKTLWTIMMDDTAAKQRTGFPKEY